MSEKKVTGGRLLSLMIPLSSDIKAAESLSRAF